MIVTKPLSKFIKNWKKKIKQAKKKIKLWILLNQTRTKKQMRGSFET